MRLTGRGASASTVSGDDWRHHSHSCCSLTAELSLEALKGPYARLTVVDRHGRRAWTNPIRR